MSCSAANWSRWRHEQKTEKRKIKLLLEARSQQMPGFPPIITPVHPHSTPSILWGGSGPLDAVRQPIPFAHLKGGKRVEGRRSSKGIGGVPTGYPRKILHLIRHLSTPPFDFSWPVLMPAHSIRHMLSTGHGKATLISRIVIFNY